MPNTGCFLCTSRPLLHTYLKFNFHFALNLKYLLNFAYDKYKTLYYIRMKYKPPSQYDIPNRQIPLYKVFCYFVFYFL